MNPRSKSALFRFGSPVVLLAFAVVGRAAAGTECDAYFAFLDRLRVQKASEVVRIRKGILEQADNPAAASILIATGLQSLGDLKEIDALKAVYEAEMKKTMVSLKSLAQKQVIAEEARISDLFTEDANLETNREYENLRRARYQHRLSMKKDKEYLASAEAKYTEATGAQKDAALRVLKDEKKWTEQTIKEREENEEALRKLKATDPEKYKIAEARYNRYRKMQALFRSGTKTGMAPSEVLFARRANNAEAYDRLRSILSSSAGNPVYAEESLASFNKWAAGKLGLIGKAAAKAGGKIAEAAVATKRAGDLVGDFVKSIAKNSGGVKNLIVGAVSVEGVSMKDSEVCTLTEERPSQVLSMDTFPDGGEGICRAFTEQDLSSPKHGDPRDKECADNAAKRVLEGSEAAFQKQMQIALWGDSKLFEGQTTLGESRAKDGSRLIYSSPEKPVMDNTKAVIRVRPPADALPSWTRPMSSSGGT